jgi:hypothetical protein
MHTELFMKKIVPDPPAFTLPDAAGCTPESLDRAAANRALDYYLTDHRPVRIAGSCTYAIPNSVNLEAALAQASDLLRCMGATANEAGNGLPCLNLNGHLIKPENDVAMGLGGRPSQWGYRLINSHVTVLAPTLSTPVALRRM